MMTPIRNSIRFGDLGAAIVFGPNENKMSDGGRDRASLGVEMWKSSQKWSVQRSAVRSIAWLGLLVVKLFHNVIDMIALEPWRVTALSARHHARDRKLCKSTLARGAVWHVGKCPVRFLLPKRAFGLDEFCGLLLLGNVARKLGNLLPKLAILCLQLRIALLETLDVVAKRSKPLAENGGRAVFVDQFFECIEQSHKSVCVKV